jgi:hypothetical protein
MVSLAIASLHDLGMTEPRRHIFLAASGQIATLVLSRTPLSEAAINHLEQAARDLKFTVLITPSRSPQSDILRSIVAAPDLVALREYTRLLPLDLSPATDERPFFFNQLPLDRPLAALTVRTSPGSTSRGNLAATGTLLLLFLISLGLVIASIVLPLRPAIRDVGRPLVVGGTLYFMFIGIGFITTEIALLQRLSVFLGHPIYSLSIVLFSIILTTGVGSMLSERVLLDTRLKLIAWSLITGGYFLTVPLYLPVMTIAFDGASLIVRALMSVLIIAPGGCLMGWGFPTGMRLISRVDRTPTPWFWGINGAAGVLASAAAVATSIAFGISVTMVLGAMCYLLLIPATFLMGAEAWTPRVLGKPIAADLRDIPREHPSF